MLGLRLAVLLILFAVGLCVEAQATKDFQSADHWRELGDDTGVVGDGGLSESMRAALDSVIAQAPQSARKAAAQWLERRLEAGHAEAADYRQLGRLYGLMADHDAQEKTLWAGLNRYRADEDLYTQLIELYEPPSGEVSPIRQADEQFQRVVTKMMRDAPESRIGRVIRGSYNLEFGYLPEAQSLFESILAENALDPDGIEGLAQVYFRRQQHERAEQVIEGALNQTPNEPRLLKVAENLYRDADNHDRADVLAERRLRLIPDPLTRGRALSQFFAARTRFVDAAQVLFEMLQDPELTVLQPEVELWASMLVMAGQTEHGLKQLPGLVTARTLAPEVYGSAEANLLASAGRWDEAEAMLLKMLKTPRADAHLCNQLAYQWTVRHQKLDEALGLIEKALRQQPDNGYFLDTKGWALYKLGRFEEASQALIRAEAQLPRSPVILLHLGDARFRMGDRNGARRRWDQARREFQQTPIGEDPEMWGSAVGANARVQALRANQSVPISPTAAEGPPEF